jgi:hypothetical protein
MCLADNLTQFESGVGQALITLMSIPVLPTDRKALAVTIASASLGVGTPAAARFIDAMLAQLAQTALPSADYLLDEAA